MSIGKILLRTAFVGVVAGGVYYYLDQNARKNAENYADPETAPGTFDPANIKDAADRAYTTIQHGTEEVTSSIRKTVGPQGSEILGNVTEAAGKVRDTVAYAGKKVGGIVTDTDYNTQEKAAAVADTVRYAAIELRDKFTKAPVVDETDVVDAESAEAEEAAAADVSEQTSADETPVEPVQAPEETPAEDAAEETVASPDVDKIEEFFDDDAN